LDYVIDVNMAQGKDVKLNVGEMRMLKVLLEEHPILMW
jgi:hypothetical protein